MKLTQPQFMAASGVAVLVFGGGLFYGGWRAGYAKASKGVAVAPAGTGTVSSFPPQGGAPGGRQRQRNLTPAQRQAMLQRLQSGQDPSATPEPTAAPGSTTVQ